MREHRWPGAGRPRQFNRLRKRTDEGGPAPRRALVGNTVIAEAGETQTVE